jgi:Mysoin-binding motif of peroxisomes
MLPFVDTINMQRYHDIYDLSRQDYQEMIQNLPSSLEEDPESLRALRTSLTRHFVARQIFLCDLLALPSESSIPDLGRWSVISDEIENLSNVIRASATIIGHLTNDEDNRSWGGQSKPRESAQHDENQALEMLAPRTPGKEKLQAQLRRLDALSQSIRGLNVRTLLMRDEANDLIERGGQSLDVGSLLARQYDIIGSELKSLTSEWDRGRNTMLSGPGAVDLLSPSRSSSGLRSPQSSVHSLGGTTAVNEGSPAAALKRLSGQSSLALSMDGLGSDEELFEAVSLPPKLKRMSMTREEKLAKMQEDRQKRATLQESRDATTSMLRELETVIKHRPRGRTTSRIPGM